MAKLLRTILLCLTLATGLMAKAEIQINELMQSNIDQIMDDLNQFPDSWVELFNNGESSINLNQYKIGTQRDGSDAYALPSFSLARNGYLVIYCDKENTGRHTSFRLESGKDCTVFLFRSTGELVDSVHIEKKQPAPNISYGRKPQNNDEWGYQYTPTPNSANSGITCTEILGDPIFSEEGRVVTNNQTLTLSLSMPENTPDGTQIRYTTDGSEPTTSSTLYSSSIKISSTKTIRAKMFCAGYLSPRSITQSYIFLGRNMNLPVISIVSKNSYFTDSKTGILVDGNYSSSKKNYQYDWRRPINLEYFEEPDSASRMNVLCETRVSGAASRSAALKSLALYTHKRFGQKHFKYEFFPDQRPGETHFKSLMLRNAGNDFDYLYMRDAIVQRTMAENQDLDWQAWRPAIIYINGTYKGILNIRERSNEENIYTNYDEEDIDMVENWGDVKEGTYDNYEEFSNFFNEHGHTWDEYAEKMDLVEYINLMIMNLYFNNLDFPGNNSMMWRPRAEGGRWRFVAKDTDYTMGLYGCSNTYKIFEWINNPSFDSSVAWANKYEHTRLFRRLMEVDEFKKQFTERCMIYCGDFLNYDAIWKIWGPMYETIKTEYPTHRKLYNQWWPNYDNELSTAQNWVRGRTNNFLNQLQSYYSLSSTTSLQINSDVAEDELENMSVTINDIQLSRPSFDGKFFSDAVVTLTGKPQYDEEGLPLTDRIVTGWTIKTFSTPYASTSKEYEGSTCQFTMTPCYKITATAKFGQDEGMDELTRDQNEAPIYYDLNGRRLDGLKKGINIVKMGDGEVRKIIY